MLENMRGMTLSGNIWCSRFVRTTSRWKICNSEIEAIHNFKACTNKLNMSDDQTFFVANYKSQLGHAVQYNILIYNIMHAIKTIFKLYSLSWLIRRLQNLKRYKINYFKCCTNQANYLCNLWIGIFESKSERSEFSLTINVN